MEKILKCSRLLLLVCLVVTGCGPHHYYKNSGKNADSKSVNPGINKHFEDPDVKKFVESQEERTFQYNRDR